MKHTDLLLFTVQGRCPVLVLKSLTVLCSGYLFCASNSWFRLLWRLLLRHHEWHLPPTGLKECAQLNQEVVRWAVIVLLHSGPDPNSLLRIILLHCFKGRNIREK